MAALLQVEAKPYTPSWKNASKSTHPPQPPPPHPAPARNSGFTTSVSSNNAVRGHAKVEDVHKFHPPPPVPPAAAAAAPPNRSPMTTLCFPTRMSPFHTPFPPVVSKMNPEAKEFIPNPPGLAAGALTSLPTSTAEIAEEQQRKQQKEEQNKQTVSPASPKWTSISTKTNSVQATPSIGIKAGVTSTVASILAEKTEEDILKISDKSKLNSNATTFMPSRTLPRPPINKPSPLALVPTSADLALNDPWCLFHLPLDDGESVKESTYDPTLVFHVHNVPTFWKVFNNIPSPRDMQYGTLYFFRNGINPKWEDSANRNGGIVRLKVETKHINEAWLLLLARTIGESWSKAVRNTVNGVVLKVRKLAYVLEIWVTCQTDALKADISDLFHPLLGVFAMHYAPHTELQERAAAAAAALAEKEKKNRMDRRR